MRTHIMPGKKHLRRILFIAVLALLMVAQGTAISMAEDEQDSSKGSSVVDDACNGVVYIFAEYENGGASGSGFGVGTAGEPTDVFVTNRHVITDDSGNVAENIYIVLDDESVQFQFLPDGSRIMLSSDKSRMIKCEVLKVSSGYPDVAVLQAEREVTERNALPVDNAESASRSQKVYALGFPADADEYNVNSTGTGYALGSVKNVTATDGTISGFKTFASTDNSQVIQHTADITHGNSGGPLITEDGAVIGINTYGVGESDYPTALYVDYAMEYLDDLNIQYDTYGDTKDSGSKDSKDKDEDNSESPVMPILCILVGVAVVVLACLKFRNKNPKGKGKTAAKKSPEATGQSGAANAGAPTVSPAPAGSAGPVRALVLVGLSGEYSGVTMKVTDRAVLGTNADTCRIIYPQGTPGISRMHCEFSITGEEMKLTDLGSTYGTFVNGYKIPFKQSITLHKGDVVYLAQRDQSFRVELGTK